MKVWITKYALTSGIIEKDAEICGNISEKMISVKGAMFPDYFHKPDWYEKREDAIKRAEEMRLKKIKSLKKQLAKLEAVKFE